MTTKAHRPICDLTKLIFGIFFFMQFLFVCFFNTFLLQNNKMTADKHIQVRKTQRCTIFKQCWFPSFLMCQKFTTMENMAVCKEDYCKLSHLQIHEYALHIPLFPRNKILFFPFGYRFTYSFQQIIYRPMGLSVKYIYRKMKVATLAGDVCTVVHCLFVAQNKEGQKKQWD